jgi:hypothetical protein
MEEPFTLKRLKEFGLFMSLIMTALFIGLGLKFNLWDYFQYTIAVFILYWCWLVFIYITNTPIVNLAHAWIAVMLLLIMILCAIYQTQLIYFN